ncbi:MAG TPA: hypothetical protein DGJ56_02240 [Verrucomicrobiales bacterium]|nr:hypothetical protein [Verrucomicrobiales bacterium]|tara:strand:- start:281 stop:571 length:291 start_codon:yes stop_codon:yes gene_type:complete
MIDHTSGVVVAAGEGLLHRGEPIAARLPWHRAQYFSTKGQNFFLEVFLVSARSTASSIPAASTARNPVKLIRVEMNKPRTMKRPQIRKLYILSQIF